MADEAAIRDWVERVLGVRVPVQADGAQGGSSADPWPAARAAALRDLKALEKKIAAMRHPRADSALILLKAIQMNLPANVTTAQAARETRRYLEEDDIIRDAERPNGFGITIELRKPLLAALGARGNG